LSQREVPPKTSGDGPGGSGRARRGLPARPLGFPDASREHFPAVAAPVRVPNSSPRPSRESSIAMNEHERPVVTAANKEAVRAGNAGDHLRDVLIGSCALAILGLILVALLVKP
jgi:hypothetical protein